MIKQVIVVRKDLNMHKGKICTQVAHASMKVFLDRIDQQLDNNSILISNLTDEMIEWINGSFTKIVVGCESYDDILFIEAQCIYKNIPFAVITDNDLTEFNGKPTVTCVAIGPDDSETIDEITGSYKSL